MSIQLLSLDDVKKSISMEEAINAMEDAFIQLAMCQVQMPLRTSIFIEPEQALNFTMPAYLADNKTLGLKVISIFPNNLKRNKSSITGFITLLNAQTGEPQALMDAEFLTALRTGAVSGLATKYFAKDAANHVAIIGSGTQARTQLEGVAAVRDIKKVSIWSRNIKNATRFATEIENKYHTQVYKSIPMAIQDADIICTATDSVKPLINFSDLRPDAHINAIGAHSPNKREIDNEVLRNSVVIVDQLSAALAESGEIISFIKEHGSKTKITELGNWLQSKKENYKNKLTLFKSVGLAIQDVSIASVVYHNAIQKNLGVLFALV